MNRDAFFAGIKPLFGTFEQSQVDGINDLLDAWDAAGFWSLDQSTPARFLAYILAGVYHECGRRMVPVREGFATSDAGARAAVRKLFEKGRIKRNYALPNAAGVSFYGRGRIQNTHEANYKKLEQRFGYPFTSQPDLLLDSKIDAKVTIYGHVEGIWTGYKLAHFITASRTDYHNARKIVNGLDRAADIAGYALVFEKAIREAVKAAPAPATAPPQPTQPKPAVQPLPPEEPATARPRGFWAWVRSWFA